MTTTTEATESASYYQVLGVKRDASGEEIRDAFKRLVLTKHPDHGGGEQEFIAVQTAYEVLADRRKRRIYDRYGESGLDKSAEALFAEDFRQGAFQSTKEQGDDLRSEVDALRRENESLQRQLMIVKPDEKESYATSFESWLRNRDPNAIQVITPETLMDQPGVEVGSYTPVKLPALENLTLEYTDLGKLTEVVTKNSQPLPTELGWGEVLVNMLAAPVGALDHHLARWGYIPGEETPSHPFTAGAEGVGLVVAVGPGVEGIKPQDLVIPKNPIVGTWRRLAIIHQRKLHPFPPNTVEPEVIANFYAYATAYRLLEDFGSLRPGDTIIQSNAHTAVGQGVIQLCRILRIKTINLVDERDDFDEIVDMLHAQGATHVWQNTGSVASRIARTRTALPRLALDAVGGSTMMRLAEALRPDSTLVAYGSATSKVDPFPYTPLLYGNMELRGFWPYRWIKQNPRGLGEMTDRLLPLLEEGKLRVEQSVWAQVDESYAAALQDSKPNVTLRFSTFDEASNLCQQLSSSKEDDSLPS